MEGCSTWRSVLFWANKLSRADQISTTACRMKFVVEKPIYQLKILGKTYRTVTDHETENVYLNYVQEDLCHLDLKMTFKTDEGEEVTIIGQAVIMDYFPTDNPNLITSPSEIQVIQ